MIWMKIEQDEMFIETETSKHIQEDDVAVMKTSDDHPYYLLKVTSLFKTKAETRGDYRHTFPPGHRVVEGHYLEIYNENNDGTLYYIDNTREALISAFFAGNCPELPLTQQKKGGKNVEIFIVDHDIHKTLYELEISEQKSLTDLLYISNFLIFYAFQLHFSPFS